MESRQFDTGIIAFCLRSLCDHFRKRRSLEPFTHKHSISSENYFRDCDIWIISKSFITFTLRFCLISIVDFLNDAGTKFFKERSHLKTGHEQLEDLGESLDLIEVRNESLSSAGILDLDR